MYSSNAEKSISRFRGYSPLMVTGGNDARFGDDFLASIPDPALDHSVLLGKCLVGWDSIPPLDFGSFCIVGGMEDLWLASNASGASHGVPQSLQTVFIFGPVAHGSRIKCPKFAGVPQFGPEFSPKRRK